jgi:hypothetical protein
MQHAWWKRKITCKTFLGRPKLRGKDNIKKDLKNLMQVCGLHLTALG